MKNIFIILTLLAININTTAQECYSTASINMNIANGITSQDQVIIEDYINYHNHKIEIPKRNNEIAMSLDYLNIDNQKTIIQVGIATKKLLDYSKMPPINVSLVIDKSGSMRHDNRLEKVKVALTHFIKGLRSKDYISIVTYDTNANIVLKATKVGDIQNLNQILERITPNGSTNLNEGLMFGYKEVEKNYHINQTNKVILLTDGIANRGVTLVKSIVDNSISYNKKGIDISTIGVGKNINYTLLQQISDAGKGANHFIGNSKEDINKVFIDELESLLSPIAKQVSLTLTYPKNIDLEYIYGYSPKFSKNTITIPLKNLNNGLTQIVLFDFELKNGIEKLPIKASLNYYSYAERKTQEIKVKTSINNKNTANYNDDILKSYCIAKMAKSLKDMAKEIQLNNPKNALNILNQTLSYVGFKFPLLKDNDILRVKNMLHNHAKKLDNINRNNTYSSLN